MTYPKGGSEYGGYPGLVQPPPHDFQDDSAEILSATVRSDPDDAGSGPETVVAEDVKRGRGRLSK